jgi:hypothetical protein
MNHFYFGDNLDVLKQLHRQHLGGELINHNAVNIPSSMKTTFKTAKRETKEDKGQEKLLL